MSSIEFTYEPDPLYPTVNGDVKERAPDDNDGRAYEAAKVEETGNRWIGQVGRLYGVLPWPELTVISCRL